jgi:hypothetical protein
VSQKCRTLISIKKLVARRIAVEYRHAAGATLARQKEVGYDIWLLLARSLGAPLFAAGEDPTWYRRMGYPAPLWPTGPAGALIFFSQCSPRVFDRDQSRRVSICHTFQSGEGLL